MNVSPVLNPVPQHIAIVMDGNGRWAKQHKLPRFLGHRRGLEALKKVLRTAAELGVRNVTVFAFSTENWCRPQSEIDFLMALFLQALERQLQKLHAHRIRFRFIGDAAPLGAKITAAIKRGEILTRDNERLTVTVAVNYGGRWDIVNAVNQLLAAGAKKISAETLRPYLALADIPEPDLYIRTGGEKRLSNFLLWQMAYTEFYFTDTLWPDFDGNDFREAVLSFQKRQRRFGRTSEQLLSERERE